MKDEHKIRRWYSLVQSIVKLPENPAIVLNVESFNKILLTEYRGCDLMRI